MKAKILVYALLTLVLITIQRAEAQQQPTKIPRIGYLIGASFISVRSEALRQGLREFGYVERKPLTSSGDLRKENSIASPRSRQS